MFKKVNVSELTEKIRNEERMKLRREIEEEKKKLEEDLCKEKIRDRRIKEFIPKLKELVGGKIVLKKKCYSAFIGYYYEKSAIDLLKISDNEKYALCKDEKEFLKPVGEIFDEFVDSFSN